jgi:1-acyl-sn-glycerol-3-phosphate acyltransferase
MRLFGHPLRGSGDTALYTLARWPVVTVFGGLYRCRVSGASNLPTAGPAILVVNHKSNADPLFIGMSFERPLRYMAKKELFSVSPFARLISSLGAFPIDRGAGDRAALTTSLAVLQAGEVLLMFPEGTRFQDDRIHPFLPGVGMLALRSGAPVVPMAMDGTQHLARDGRPGLPKVRGLVGPPLELDDIEGRGSKAYHEAAARMQAAVERLYGRLTRSR